MKRVVLVRPNGPRNVGSVLRVAANFGPCDVVLVAPERPSILVHPDFEQMAHGVPGFRERARVVATLGEALADTTWSIAFSGRSHEHRTRVDWRELQGSVSERANEPSQLVALVFGNEMAGLASDEVGLCNQISSFATSAEHTSLNLAMAVGIALSDLFVARAPKRRERGMKGLSGTGREYLKANLKHVFGGKVARSADARRSILESIERVFSRAELEDRDARAWHLMCRALGSELTPKDIGVKVHEKRERHRREQARARERAAERPSHD